MSYKAQLSVGLHVLVMMGTFYSAGHVGASYISAEKTHVRPWSPAGPVYLLVGARLTATGTCLCSWWLLI